MTDFPKFLTDGYKRFKTETYEQNKDVYQRLAVYGQTPRVLVVGCSDSRVDPKIIFGAESGELFTVRNVANLVPPYETDGAYHGVSAALEYGIMHLEIQHVVVLGHVGCGGIKAMMDPKTELREDMTFISNWVMMMSEQRDQVLADMPDATPQEHVAELEHRSIEASLGNLRTFPFVQKKMEDGLLYLHGAYYNLHSGSLFVLNQETKKFEQL